MNGPGQITRTQSRLIEVNHQTLGIAKLETVLHHDVFRARGVANQVELTIAIEDIRNRRLAGGNRSGRISKRGRGRQQRRLLGRTRRQRRGNRLWSRIKPTHHKRLTVCLGLQAGKNLIGVDRDDHADSRIERTAVLAGLNRLNPHGGQFAWKRAQKGAHRADQRQSDKAKRASAW